ncbi:MAG: helix-turn-helix transcriptional regulator [Ruminococcus sp.]
MTFAEKLKTIRKQAGMSQEKLAEKIGVSRQAITKWEGDNGTPDIENIMAISAIFNVSIDELFSNEKSIKRQKDFLYESVTEYDIEQAKRYDMKLGGANTLVLSGYDGEKIRVRLASNTLSTLQKDFKVKIDDVKKRIDIDVFRKNGMTEAIAKEAVMIFVQLPNQYIGKIEASVNSQRVELRSIKCDSIELDTKTSNVTLENVEGTVELNCNLDMDITCLTLNGSVEINQISATSRISVPSDAHFSAVAKGIGTSITFEKSGKKTDSFAEQESDNIIELNGMKSELVISAQD